MPTGTVVAICISPVAGAPMQYVQKVEALLGEGLWGDRYAKAAGSYNKGIEGKRQVTLINALFVLGSGFTFDETRRNIMVRDIELMDQIGHEFAIGSALLKGVKYCDPCMRPNRLLERTQSFQETFYDRGGLVAEIILGGYIEVGSVVVPRKKNY